MSHSCQVAEEKFQPGSGLMHPTRPESGLISDCGTPSLRILVHTPGPPNILTHTPVRKDTPTQTCRTHKDPFFPGNSASVWHAIVGLSVTSAFNEAPPTPTSPEQGGTVLKTTVPKSTSSVTYGTIPGARSLLGLVVLPRIQLSVRPQLRPRTPCPGMPRSRKTCTGRASRRRPGRAGAPLLFVGAWEGKRCDRSQDLGRAGADQIGLGPGTKWAPGPRGPDRTVGPRSGWSGPSPEISTSPFGLAPGPRGGRAGRRAEAAQGLPSVPREGPRRWLRNQARPSPLQPESTRPEVELSLGP